MVLPSPVVSVPTTTTQTVSLGATGGWDLSAGGNTPASGTSGVNASGPHMEEIQTTTIQYCRVPYFGFLGAEATLSGLATAYHTESTNLFVRVTATYQKRRSYEQFPTTHWTQWERFVVDAVSADVSGNSYGTLDASNLGPQGTISNLQPWYYRRPWDSSVDTEVSKTFTGFSCCKFKKRDVESLGPDSSTKAYGVIQNNWWYIGGVAGGDAAFLEPGLAGAVRPYTEAWAYDALPLGWMPGGYSVALEPTAIIPQFIHEVGQKITSESWVPTNTIGALGTQVDHPFFPDDLRVGIPEYYTARHNYS